MSDWFQRLFSYKLRFLERLRLRSVRGVSRECVSGLQEAGCVVFGGRWAWGLLYEELTLVERLGSLGLTHQAGIYSQVKRGKQVKMSAQAQMRAMLDQLMGTSRDGECFSHSLQSETKPCVWFRQNWFVTSFVVLYCIYWYSVDLFLTDLLKSHGFMWFTALVICK